MHMHKRNHSTRHLSLIVSVQAYFKSWKTSRCSWSWCLFPGQLRNQTLRPVWPVCENNSLFWGVLLQEATVLMESGWKETRVVRHWFCLVAFTPGALLYFFTLHKLLFTNAPFLSDTFEWSSFFFLVCVSKLLIFYGFIKKIKISASCSLVHFSLFHSLSVSSTISLLPPSLHLQNLLFHSSLYLYLAFLCWV